MFHKSEEDTNFRLGFKIKLGFTLAEILIVLTVIGVIATITIPQLTGGVDEAQAKAALKKAYSTLANIAAIEKAEGNLPTKAATSSSQEEIINFFIALDDNIEVEGYVPINVTSDDEEEYRNISVNQITPGVEWQGQIFGDKDNYATSTYVPWIIAADGMAFRVRAADAGRTCQKRSRLNTATSFEDFKAASCFRVVVDVNGLNKGPNKIDPQTGHVSSSQKLKKLTGDWFNFYVASDGIAKGSPLCTLTGRLLAGEK